MDDREMFEDPTTFQRYLRAVPFADTAYRRHLRDQLVAGVAHRTILPAFRWRMVLSAAVVACLAVAATVLPLRSRTAITANAYQILGALAQGTSVPYTGSALITYTVSAKDRVPLAISRDLGGQKIVTHWTVLDSTHYRVDSHVLSPEMLAWIPRLLLAATLVAALLWTLFAFVLADREQRIERILQSASNELVCRLHPATKSNVQLYGRCPNQRATSGGNRPRRPQLVQQQSVRGRAPGAGHKRRRRRQPGDG
ncbi:MAG: hypothetical protein ACR2JC_14140 [Chloroflexota bacterium]